MLKRIRKKHHEKTASNQNTMENGSSNGISLNTEKKKFFSLSTLKNLKIAYIPYNELLKEGFFAGIGWAFGVTIGFVIISTLIVLVFSHLGGIPLIGGWVADIVEETQNQLMRRTPVF